MSGNYRNCHMRFIFGLVPWCCGWWAVEVGMLFLLLLINPDLKKTQTTTTIKNPGKTPNETHSAKYSQEKARKAKCKQPPAQNTISVIEMNVSFCLYFINIWKQNPGF